MKIMDGMRIIEKGWIRKPKGFRIRFDQRTETGLEAGHSPPIQDAPLNSDVTAWRYAWKLWQATMAGSESDEPGTLYNITVVDDTDRPFQYYATGEFETYNPKVTGNETDPA